MEEQPYSNEVNDDGIPIIPDDFHFKFLYIEKDEDGWGDRYLWNLRDKYREVQKELKEYLFAIAQVAHMKNRGEKLVGMFDGGIAGIYTDRLNRRLQNISTACHINGFEIKKFYNTFDSFLYNELVEFLLAPEGKMACNICGKLILYPHPNQLSHYKLGRGPVYCRYEGDENDRNSCWRKSRREKSRESKAKSRAEKKQNQKNQIQIPIIN
ncbi:hypothetical protein [Paenibacillus gansuensis]|uniref:Uncharacterized protein n=1 Tax=Paenibacillus gansuensis TaxID=306542 RepID=A0ABW5PII9_9BACL